MPKPISKKQLLANRRNARKSTGPKGGPKRSPATRKLITQGLLAKEVVITCGDGAERKSAFNALLAALCDELKPQGLVEEILVERIATSYWRMRRALRYEMGAIRDLLDDCHTDDTPDKELSRLHKLLRQAEDCLADEQRTLKALATPPDLTDPRILDVLRPALEQLAADHDLTPLHPPGAANPLANSILSDGEPETVEGQRDQHPPSLLHVLQQAGLTGQRLQDALRAAQRKVVKKCEAEVNHLREQLDSARHDRELRRNRRLHLATPI